MILGFGVVLGILFLEETCQKRKYQHDAGIEAGKWLVAQLRQLCPSKAIDMNNEKLVRGYHSLMEDEELPNYSIAEGEELPGYRTTEGSPRQSSSRSPSPNASRALDSSRNNRMITNEPHDVKRAFNKQVVLNIVGFGILA